MVNKNTAIQEKLAKAVGALVVKFDPGASSKLLDQFWRPGDVFNDDNEKEILKWLKDNGIEEVPIQLFIVGGKYKEKREKAVEDLKLPRE